MDFNPNTLHRFASDGNLDQVIKIVNNGTSVNISFCVNFALNTLNSCSC